MISKPHIDFKAQKKRSSPKKPNLPWHFLVPKKRHFFKHSATLVCMMPILKWDWKPWRKRTFFAPEKWCFGRLIAALSFWNGHSFRDIRSFSGGGGAAMEGGVGELWKLQNFSHVSQEAANNIPPNRTSAWNEPPNCQKLRCHLCNTKTSMQSHCGLGRACLSTIRI